MSQLVQRSRIWFDWRADRCSLDALGGHVGVLTRAATATGRDSAGVNYTAINHQPAWYWFDLDSDGVFETPALRMGASDVLYWSALWLPASWTLYAQIITDFDVTSGAATAGVVSLTNSSGANPFFYLAHINATVGFLGRHHNGSALQSTGGLANPGNAAQVELRLEGATNGSIIAGQSIAGAAETTQANAAANAYAAAWASPTRLYAASIGGANPGAIFLRRIKGVKGVRTMAQCRADY